MTECYFSMIVYVDEEDGLARSLDSILDVTPQGKDMQKLIVADAVCTDVTKRVCDSVKGRLSEKRFVYLSMPGATIGEAYNKATDYTEGRYVNYSLASTWFEPKALDAIHAMAVELKQPKLLSLAPWTVNEKGEFVQYKMSPRASGLYQEISLHDTPEKLQLMLPAFFIRCWLVRSTERRLRFRPERMTDAPMEFLANLLAEMMCYTYLPEQILHYTRQLEDNTSAFMEQHYPWWYMDSLRNWILPFAEAWDARNYPLRNSMRILLLYLVFARYNCNLNDRDKGVVQRSDIPELRMLTGKILQYVDNRIIYSKTSLQNFTIPRAMKLLFMEIKAEQSGCVCEPVVQGNRLMIWTHKKYGDLTERAIDKIDYRVADDAQHVRDAGKELDVVSRAFTVSRGENSIPVVKWVREEESLLPVCELEKEHVILQAVNYSKNCLKIDGLLSLGNFLKREDIRLYLYKDGKEYTRVHPIDVYDLKKVYGVTYARDYRFYVEVPVFALGKSSEVQFVVEVNGERVPLEIRSGEVYAHITEKVKGSYWNFAKGWSLSIVRKNRLLLEKVTEAALVKKETEFQKTIEKLGSAAAKRALRLRKKYFETREKYKGRRIWITFDKLYKAGDNGEYMYHYISGQNDGIEIYYLIKRDSPDYERLLLEEKQHDETMWKESVDGRENANSETMPAYESHILVWGEERTLLMALHAEAILDTHANAYSYMGFETEWKPYLGDLFATRIICIQHGLTVQKIAQFQNRLFDNTSLYLCASQHEIDNLSKSIYGYIDTSILLLAGIARYDGLKNNDKKQILITPTWRRNIANSNVAHFKKGHNDFFRESDYFQIYNRLINDTALISAAKRYGYRLIYLLHPAASAQMEDFDRNDDVEMLQAAGDMNYEKILTESSLMVTDYSGIQFDFAYMRKPILYYHPAELPPHYDESSAYVYERDAFGPLISNHDELVKELCEYMKDHCIMKPEYQKRADEFFAFNDFGNCERIYETIREFMAEQ